MPAASLPAPKENAKDRVLRAAALLFAKDGLVGATTRQISQAAGVNEVTLFRLFHNKEGLIAAVVEQLSNTVAADDPSAQEEAPLPEIGPKTRDLRPILRQFAQTYHRLVSFHLPLLRTFIGEIERHQEYAKKILEEVFQPRRTELLGRLQKARDLELLDPAVDPRMVVEQFTGMIFLHVLRSSGLKPVEYGSESYLESCVEMIARGIGPRGATRGNRLKP